MTCSISKNHEQIKLFQTHFESGKNSRLKRLGFMILMSLIFFAVNIYFRWPNSSFLIFFGLMGVIHFLTYDYGKIIINEDVE